MKEYTKNDFDNMNFNEDLSLEDIEVENEVDSTLIYGCVKDGGEWRDLTENEMDILSDNFSEFIWEKSHGF